MTTEVISSHQILGVWRETARTVTMSNVDEPEEEETYYEDMAKFAMLIIEGTTLSEAKEWGYVITRKDEIAWKEVRKNPGDYPPSS